MSRPPVVTARRGATPVVEEWALAGGLERVLREAGLVETQRERRWFGEALG